MARKIYRRGRGLKSGGGRRLKYISPAQIPALLRLGRIGWDAARGLYTWTRGIRAGRAVAIAGGLGVGGVGAGAAATRTHGREPKRFRRDLGPVPKARSFTPQAEFGGYKCKYVTVGRAARIPRTTLKLGFNKRVLRWQRCNVMNDASLPANSVPGALTLSHATVNVDQTRAPCFLMCLNHTNNQSALTIGPAYNLLFNNTGNVVLEQVQCGSGSGTTQNKWAVDFAAPDFSSGETDPELRYIMNAYYDIRLNCYGCSSQPTVYDVMVVSFLDQYDDPLETPSTAQEASDRHAVFQSMVQKYMTNPILPVISVKKKYRVYARQRIVIQPTTTIENDVTPSSKIIKMFVRDGSIYDYMYHSDGFSAAGADDKLSTTQWQSVGTTSTADYSDFPSPKARKWLIVRAMNTTRTAAIGLPDETKSNTPSFDLMVRKAEYAQAR